jgi:hypothetical protein
MLIAILRAKENNENKYLADLNASQFHLLDDLT